jgi:HK97 family phage major capsid protein
MSLAAQLRELRTKRAAAVDVADKTINKAYSEKRNMTAEEDQIFTRAHAEAAELKKQVEQIESHIAVRTELSELAPDNRLAGKEDNNGEQTRATERKPIDPKIKARYESLEFRSNLSNMTGVFASMYGSNVMPAELQKELNHLRETYGPLAAQMFDTTNLTESEKRALSATTGPSTAATGTAGASTVPQGFVQKLEISLKYFGGILDAADYLDTDNGAPLPYPTMDDASNLAELTSENSVVAGADVSGGSAESDPSYGVVTFQAYMYDSGFVRVPIQLLQDSAFNVEDYLVEALKIRIGRKITAAFTTGTGSSQPKGVVTAATLGVTADAGDTTSFSYNELVGLYHSVDPAYREGPKVGWMMSDTALLAIRKVKDSNNRPLFIAGGTAEGIQNGAPETLLGKRYWINQAVAVPAASAKSLLFGDFSKYKIRRVRQIGMAKVDQLFISSLQVGFLAYQRFDGNLVDAGTHPIKYIQNAAS